jgi:hypothetical protein
MGGFSGPRGFLHILHRPYDDYESIHILMKDKWMVFSVLLLTPINILAGCQWELA